MSFPVWFLLSLFIITEAQSNCPPLYRRFSKDHTYCKPPAPTCNILQSSVSSGDISVILQEHNKYRDQIAKGQIPNLPAASDMLQMVWDDELAAVAQAHANQCKFEHDCPNCRRVQNFGVGQNLAFESIRGAPNLPAPKWRTAIKSWYDEIQYFPKNSTDSFIAPPPEPTYGHFTQLIWAKSWRVGCGYVLYTEGNTYKKLYTCNYGPAGNIINTSVYKNGSVCSSCPVNSCCGKECGSGFRGLCRIKGQQAPVYKVAQNRIFNCEFQSQNSDCSHFVTGTNKWLKYQTLSGNFIGIVLQGGEESTMVFNNIIEPTIYSFCFVISYRKGPNVDGQETANTADETFVVLGGENEIPFKHKLPNFDGDLQQQFSVVSTSLFWNQLTRFEVTFSVPPGKPEQFMEIKSIYATDGPCQQ